MNIFVLDSDPELAARYHCNKHVVKMVLETAQMLCTVYQCQNIDAPYKLAHKNHPCSIWARTSSANFAWLCALGLSLCNEYSSRYNKIHASEKVIGWCIDNMNLLKFDDDKQTDFAIAMPEFCNISSDPIECYRYYYVKVKKKFAVWPANMQPEWFSNLREELYDSTHFVEMSEMQR